MLAVVADYRGGKLAARESSTVPLTMGLTSPLILGSLQWQAKKAEQARKDLEYQSEKKASLIVKNETEEFFANQEAFANQEQEVSMSSSEVSLLLQASVSVVGYVPENHKKADQVVRTSVTKAPTSIVDVPVQEVSLLTERTGEAKTSCGDFYLGSSTSDPVSDFRNLKTWKWPKTREGVPHARSRTQCSHNIDLFNPRITSVLSGLASISSEQGSTPCNALKKNEDVEPGSWLPSPLALCSSATVSVMFMPLSSLPSYPVVMVRETSLHVASVLLSLSLLSVGLASDFLQGKRDSCDSAKKKKRKKVVEWQPSIISDSTILHLG